MIPRRTLAALLGIAVVLPIAICVTLGVAYLLRQMQDTASAGLLDGAAAVEIVLWIVDLICLLLALAVNTFASGSGGSSEK